MLLNKGLEKWANVKELINRGIAVSNVGNENTVEFVNIVKDVHKAVYLYGDEILDSLPQSSRKQTLGLFGLNKERTRKVDTEEEASKANEEFLQLENKIYWNQTLKRKIDIIEAKQELESKLRKAAIETVGERIDDLEEKIANITELVDDTEEGSFERKNRKSDSNRVKLLSEDIKSLKDDFSSLVRAFSVEKKQNIQNKLELAELNARVSREQNKNDVSEVVNSILKKEIAKLEQQVYINITEQLREKIKVNADMKEESHYEKAETSERKVADYQHGSCSELLEKGVKTENGIYTIYPQGRKKTGIRVYCDQTTDGGGWTVFQRRKDGSENFYRNWKEYKVGFGRLDGEFWLGNDYLSVLTSSGHNELRIDLEGWENERCYAEYSGFRIGPETENYSLHFSKFLEGTCGDSLTYHNGMSFSTKDRDNDMSTFDCAEFTGGWWFNACHLSGLNGAYNKKSPVGVYWYHWKRSNSYSCKSSEMKFRKRT